MGATGLGNLLVKEGLLSEQDRLTIAKTCGQSSWAFAKCILAMGTLDEDELAAFFAERTKYQVAARNILDQIDPDILSKIDARMAARLEVLPIKADWEQIQVAVCDPLDKGALRQLEFFTGLQVAPLIAPLSTIYSGLQSIIPEFKPHFPALSNFLQNHAATSWQKIRIEEEGLLDANGDTEELDLDVEDLGSDDFDDGDSDMSDLDDIDELSDDSAEEPVDEDFGDVDLAGSDDLDMDFSETDSDLDFDDFGGDKSTTSDTTAGQVEDDLDFGDPDDGTDDDLEFPDEPPKAETEESVAASDGEVDDFFVAGQDDELSADSGSKPLAEPSLEPDDDSEDLSSLMADDEQQDDSEDLSSLMADDEQQDDSEDLSTLMADDEQQDDSEDLSSLMADDEQQDDNEDLSSLMPDDEQQDGSDDLGGLSEDEDTAKDDDDLSSLLDDSKDSADSDDEDLGSLLDDDPAPQSQELSSDEDDDLGSLLDDDNESESSLKSDTSEDLSTAAPEAADDMEGIFEEEADETSSLEDLGLTDNNEDQSAEKNEASTLADDEDLSSLLDDDEEKSEKDSDDRAGMEAVTEDEDLSDLLDDEPKPSPETSTHDDDLIDDLAIQNDEFETEGLQVDPSSNSNDPSIEAPDEDITDEERELLAGLDESAPTSLRDQYEEKFSQLEQEKQGQGSQNDDFEFDLEDDSEALADLPSEPPILQTQQAQTLKPESHRSDQKITDDQDEFEDPSLAETVEPARLNEKISAARKAKPSADTGQEASKEEPNIELQADDNQSDDDDLDNIFSDKTSSSKEDDSLDSLDFSENEDKAKASDALMDDLSISPADENEQQLLDDIPIQDIKEPRRAAASPKKKASKSASRHVAAINQATLKLSMASSRDKIFDIAGQALSAFTKGGSIARINQGEVDILRSWSDSDPESASNRWREGAEKSIANPPTSGWQRLQGASKDDHQIPETITLAFKQDENGFNLVILEIPSEQSEDQSLLDSTRDFVSLLEKKL